MRTLALITIALISNMIFGQNKSLKIETGDQTIIYPFYLETEIIDKNDNLVYDTNDLFADDSKTFTGEHTVKVYTYWGNGEDVFIIKKQGTVSFTNDSEELEPLAEEIKSLPKDRLLLVDKNFTKNKNGEFNAKLTFEDNIIFNYTDGKIEVTQNQIPLQVTGNVVSTSEGFLSIDYDPKSKEYHYEILRLLDEEELPNL